MLTRFTFAVLLVTLAQADQSQQKTDVKTKSSHVDKWNKYIDRQFTEPLSYHFLWPWNQLFKAVAALDEDAFETPKVISNKEKYEIQLNVKRFKPEDLKITVKNRNIFVEGKHKECDNKQQFLANHFVQNFMIPLGSKAEEVKAVLKEDGVLAISVPKHEIPPPPPEREVPIEVLFTEKPLTTVAPELATTEKAEKVETTVTDKKVEAVESSSAMPLEQLELVEATTHVGKIRKKELKDPKPSRVNEVSKGVEENGLDYALIDTE